MNRNLYIKEKLKMFLLLIYDFKIKNEEGQEQLNIPQSIKSVLIDFYNSNALKIYFKKRGDELQKGFAYLKFKISNSKKDNLTIKKNITCFNQTVLYRPQIFFTSQNELNIFNEVICLKLFQRIKDNFIEGYEHRKSNLSHRFMLASNHNNEKINLKKNQNTLSKKHSMRNLSLFKQRNFLISDKINNNLSPSQLIKNIKDKLLNQKIKLPYINNVNIIENVGLKKNKSHKKLIYKRKNIQSNLTFEESQRIKKEKIKQQSKENYDYSGIFKLYNYLNNSNQDLL